MSLALALVLCMLLVGGALVYGTGGTKYVYLHIMYIPIVVAAFWFKAPGGLLAGMLAGLIVGPLMPRVVAGGESQETFAWLYRTAFFCLVGLVIGQMADLLHRRLARLRLAMDSLSATYAQTLKTFASLVALRDETTGGHCERVAHNACILGEALGFRQAELEALYWAGILHDLGKMATPAAILLKPGRLTPEEYQEIQKHASLGADILTSVSDEFELIAEGIRSHHERWDGNGYPRGLKAQRIPLFGRLLALVDVFEALTSERPYRAPMPVPEALEYLRAQAGTHFDPALVPLFEELFAAGRIYVSSDPEAVPLYDAPLRFGITARD